MKKYFHVCIGCLVKLYITKKWWLYCKKTDRTVCDECFFDVADIITKNKNNHDKLIIEIRAYQKIHENRYDKK